MPWTGLEWSLEQLAGYSEAEIRQWHGIGPNALKTLGEALNAKGLSFQKEKDFHESKE